MTTTVSGTSGIIFPDTTTQTTAATASIPSGAITNFANASAPTGWTQVVTYNDYAMRIVSGTGAGTGGSVAFTTAFASQTPAGSVNASGLSAAATTLTTSQVPAHAHQMSSGVGLTPTGAYSTFTSTNPASKSATQSNTGVQNLGTDNTGGGGSHTHTISGSATFTGTAINLAVQYVDNILCQKS